MAVVTKPVVFQVVGYQNSGKTTTMVKLINELTNNNFKVASIKHHGHGGKPDVVTKDSVLHSEAGSIAAIVEGDGSLLLQSEQKNWPLEKQIALMSFFNPDIILVEGYKYENFPKLVLLRDDSDDHLLEKLTNVVSVLDWRTDESSYKLKQQYYIKGDKWIPLIVQTLETFINNK